jgi:hypothetical protein
MRDQSSDCAMTDGAMGIQMQISGNFAYAGRKAAASGGLGIFSAADAIGLCGTGRIFASTPQSAPELAGELHVLANGRRLERRRALVEHRAVRGIVA